MNLQDPQELDDASIALIAWMRSQDIKPFESVLLMEYTIARMIVGNMKSIEDMEAKISLVETSIREIIPFIKARL